MVDSTTLERYICATNTVFSMEKEPFDMSEEINSRHEGEAYLENERVLEGADRRRFVFRNGLVCMADEVPDYTSGACWYSATVTRDGVQKHSLGTVPYYNLKKALHPLAYRQITLSNNIRVRSIASAIGILILPPKERKRFNGEIGTSRICSYPVFQISLKERGNLPIERIAENMAFEILMRDRKSFSKLCTLWSTGTKLRCFMGEKPNQLDDIIGKVWISALWRGMQKVINYRGGFSDARVV